MNFNINSTFLYVVAALIVLFVLAQSVFSMIRSYKHGIEIGMDRAKLRKTIAFAAVFTIAPACSILIGVITLSKFLGIPLPWARMSVIGAITYELPAATSTANALGISLSSAITDAKTYSAMAWVMTLGIMPSIVFPPILMKRIRGGVLKIQNKDSKWGDIFMSSLFIGMIAAFMGMVFADVRTGIRGWIPVFVLMFSAAVMGICGFLIKKCNMKWLETYALSISMVCAMIFAAIITPIIG